MSENTLVLGAELLYLQSSGVDLLKEHSDSSGKVNVYQVQDHTIITPINTDTSDFVEDNAFDLGVDTTRFTAVYFNKQDNMIFPAEKLISLFQQTEEEESDKDFPISLFPDYVDFVADHEADVDNEIYNLVTQYYANTIYAESSVPDSEAGDGSDPAEVNQIDESSATIADTEHETKQEPVAVEDDFEDDVAPLLRKEEAVEPEQVERSDFEKPAESKPAVQENSNAPELSDSIDDLFSGQGTAQNNDPLYEAAQTIFAQSRTKSLPSLSNEIQGDLQSQLISATQKVDEARQRAIDSIQSKLSLVVAKNKEKAKQETLVPAEKKHENTLQVIDDNLDQDIADVTKKSQKEYDKQKAAWIKSQIPALEDAYDAKNLKDHQVKLRANIDGLKQQSEQQRQAEIKVFSEYQQKIEQMTTEQAISKVDVTDVIAQFDSVVTDQSQELIKAAETKEKENDRLYRQLQQAESENKTIRATFDEQVTATAQAKIAEEKIKSQQYAEKMAADLKAQRLANDKLQKEIEDERRKSTLLALKAENHKQEQALKEQVPIKEVDTPPKSSKFAKNNGFKAGVATLALFILMGSSFAVGSKLSGNNATSQADRTVQVQTSSKPTVKSDKVEASSSSKKATTELQTGDTFPYTTFDGKKVIVTVDSGHSGHYVDDQGQHHSIIY